MKSQDYIKLYQGAEVNAQGWDRTHLDTILGLILANQTVYSDVQRLASVPWPVVAAIHYRESELSFSKHLHNGDPLTDRTVHEPKGRPDHGKPPFTWIESADDAFSLVWFPVIWNLAGCLEFMERYNGLGYQHFGINSPYLWSQTNQYTSGLFVADGTFDLSKRDMRPGCVAILKELGDRGFNMDFSALDARDSSLH